MGTAMKGSWCGLDGEGKGKGKVKGRRAGEQTEEIGLSYIEYRLKVVVHLEFVEGEGKIVLNLLVLGVYK